MDNNLDILLRNIRKTVAESEFCKMSDCDSCEAVKLCKEINELEKQ